MFFPAWTFNGTVPGPILRATEGDILQVRFVNGGEHPHTIHFHGIHPTNMDGVFEIVHPARSSPTSSRRVPGGLHPYHCHSTPLKKHIHKGLYGALIIDPKEPRPEAEELVMVMNGYDTDADGGNNFYTVNGRSFYYAKYPIRVSRSKPVRIYLLNLTEFDLINSFHLHADFFRYQPTGTGDYWEYTDTVMQCQGQRGVIEIDFANTGRFMFHAHQSEFTEARLDGLLRRHRLMEARGDGDGRLAAGWRLWALGPILRLGRLRRPLRWTGSSVLDLIGKNPPPADEFDIRRVEFSPGEIRISVRNPQREQLTIASVTVDDAIVPFSLDGPSTLDRLRSSTIVVPFDWVEDDPIAVGVTSSTGIETVQEIAAAIETPEPSSRSVFGYALIGFLVGVVPVALGLMWLPSLRRADPRWLAAFMALTAGLLTFLGIEALFEAFELQAALPGQLGGPGLVLLGVALSFLAMTFVSERLGRGPGGGKGALGGIALATLVAIGIGITTSARDSRSARRSHSASLRSGASSSSASWSTTSPRG